MCFFNAKIVQSSCKKASGPKTHCNILMQLLLLLLALTSTAAGGNLPKGLTRTRSAKIASIHGLQAAAESLPAHAVRVKDAGHETSTEASSASRVAGRYEIHAVSGEPNYKSVNLTWEVEFVGVAGGGGAGNGGSLSSVYAPKTTETTVTNGSAEVEPPKAFQIFYCELQSFGPHRCRSKLLDGRLQQVEDTYHEHSRQLRHYAAQIDNLRMATRYSFHIRAQQQHKAAKITGRSEIFNNEIEEAQPNLGGYGAQTIVMPTKGFSAQATKCLPHASEIEVETGPHFGGKIVVDGGNCGIKGNPNDARDKYTMRIDHKLCGSLVKPETNTVETFITVQENLGIFTHSTRRFVVVCSFQSGMQTVRASFTVPRKEGVASAVENDPFEPDDDRMGRGERQMRYVDKSALVLKGSSSSEQVGPTATGEGGEGEGEEGKREGELSGEAETARVREVSDPKKTEENLVNAVEQEADEKEREAEEAEEEEEEEEEKLEEEYKKKKEYYAVEKTDTDSQNAQAVVEYIVPGINEGLIKHYDEQQQQQQQQHQKQQQQLRHYLQQQRRQKLNRDQDDANQRDERVNEEEKSDHQKQQQQQQDPAAGDYEQMLNDQEAKTITTTKSESEAAASGHARSPTKYAQLMADHEQEEEEEGAGEWYDLVFKGKAADDSPALQQFASNLGSIVLTILLSVIMIGVFVYVVVRETQRQTLFKASSSAAAKRRPKSAATSPQSQRQKYNKTLTQTIAHKQQQQQQHQHQPPPPPPQQQRQCNL